MEGKNSVVTEKKEILHNHTQFSVKARRPEHNLEETNTEKILMQNKSAKKKHL